MNTTSLLRSRGLAALLAATATLVGGTSPVAADDIAVGAANPADATVQLLLSRQKGETLRVYMNERSTYVNGRSISKDLLTRIVKESGLEKAVISAEPYALRTRIANVRATIVEAGIEDVELTTPNRDRELTAKEKRGLILSRQKGETLRVYMNNRGLYVNGSSVSGEQLTTVVRESNLTSAEISAEPYLSDARVERVAATLRAAGIETVERAQPRD